MGIDNWGKPGRASVLVGGQFGSEGKGLAAAYLAGRIGDGHAGIATTNAGAQAGHTTKYKDGREFVCYHLPTTGVVKPGWLSYINAGSIINPEVLEREIRDTGVPNVVVHPRAAIIEPRHTVWETNRSAGTTRTGSTQKGVGAALCSKLMREMNVANGHVMERCRLDTIDLNRMLDGDIPVTVEIPQGTGLSINHGCAYPYTTSRDCYLTTGLSDAGIHPHWLGEVAMVVRTFPIRVGHIYDNSGQQVGYSGPFFDDSWELDWARDFPGIEPERTTVTKRVRRIASWSNKQYAAALRLNRPTIIMLTFCDYFRSVAQFEDHLTMMSRIEESVLGYHPELVCSVGPCVEDVMEVQEVHYWLRRRGDA